MIYRLVAFVGWIALTTSLRAETYADWVSQSPGKSAIPFTAWLAPETTETSINGQGYTTFDSPIGHLFGHLDFSAFPPDAFPLRLRVLYHRIDPSELARNGTGAVVRASAWTSPLNHLARDASLGELLEKREVSIDSPAEGAAVPVWGIWAVKPQGQYEGGNCPYSVLVEVAAHDGTLLARECLIEAVLGTTQRSVTLAKTNSIAEPYRKPINDIARITTVDQLPLEEEVYDDAKILWLDDATLHDPAYPDSFWHRVFLAGALVVGPEAEVGELAQRLGVSPNEPLLRGGLWTAGHEIDDLTKLETNQSSGHYDLQLKDEDNPFRNAIALGAKRCSQLRSFSIWFLATFTLFEVAIIIGSFSLLHGPRRVFRWLLIPFSSMIYTALGLAVVHLVVDFRPEVEIFREVDSVEGWPESRVTTQIKRLGFGDARVTFSAPARAAYNWSSLSPGAVPYQSAPAGGVMSFSLRQRYGRFLAANIGYEQPGESPCQITANREIVATRPLRGAWLWDGHCWRNLGPMKPGQPIAIDRANVVVDPTKISVSGEPRDEGNPWAGDNSFPETVRAFCYTGYMGSLKGTHVGVLLAIDDRAVPEKMADAAESEIRTRTLVVHQFQFPSPTPTP